MALLLLGSCSGNDSWCVTTDPNAYLSKDVIKTVTNNTFTLQGTGNDPTDPTTPTGGWINTQVSVASGDQITISATGTIVVAMPYGLESAVTAGASNNAYVQALGSGTSTTSYFENNGLGHQIVVEASSTTPVSVNSPGVATPFNFVPSQTVYVTTAACATGDYLTATPTKWTWKAWNTEAVHCNPRGTRNFTATAPACKAVLRCCSTCTTYRSWECQYVVESTSTAIVDTCGSSAPSYNCQANTGGSSACYNTTSFISQDGDWCDGSHKAGGVTVSNSSPGSCGQNDPNANITTPALNSCGSTDSCWNTGGYLLYAIQTGVSCPNDKNCIHLNQSSENSANGGQSFSSLGGPLYLKIIDPNAPVTSTVDVATLQNDIATNSATIASLTQQNQDLANSLYMVSGQTILTDGTVATSNGQLLAINAYNSQLSTDEATATTQASGNYAPAGLSQISSDLGLLLQSFATYSGQLSPTDDTTIPWNILGTMATQTTNLIAEATALAASTKPRVPPYPIITPSIIAGNTAYAFANDLNSTLQSLSTAIAGAQTTNTTMNTNSATIDSLSAQNTTYSSQILAANNSAATQAVGGYTTYVRSDPLIATNGEYANAAFSSGNPNAGAQIISLGLINQNLNNTYTAPSAGSIWVQLADPDGNYGNNAGSYTILIDKINESYGFSSLITTITNHIQNGLMLAVKQMYEGMTCTGPNSVMSNCTDYFAIINFMLVMYVIIFGIMFLFGLIRTDHVDFVMRLVKIGFIITLLTPGSFAFFNQYLFTTLLDLSNSLIASATGAPPNDPFNFLGQSIAVLLLDATTYLKVISLMFQGLLGFVVFILLVYGTVEFVKAIFNALTTYIMCIVGLIMCFAVTPIFLPCVLFHQTRHLFDNWFKAMVRFAFEPVILFIGLIIINSMLLVTLQQLFNFSSCFKCTFPFTFSLPGFPELGSTELLCLPFFSPWGVDNLGSGTPFAIFMPIPVVITFCIITKVMEIYSKALAKQMADAILGTGRDAASFMSEGGAKLGMNPFDKVSKGTAQVFGQDKESKARRKDAAGANAMPSDAGGPKDEGGGDDGGDDDATKKRPAGAKKLTGKPSSSGAKVAAPSKISTGRSEL